MVLLWLIIILKYMILCEMVCLGLRYEIALVTICAVLTEEYLNF